jgi:hypothetical protein
VTGPEHAAIKRSDSFYADLKRGVKCAIARRAKLLVYLLAAASFLIANGYVSGHAEAVLNTVIALVGALSLHQVPNAPAVATGPKPHERATERGHADPEGA